MKATIVIGHIALVQRSKRQDFILDVIAGLRKKGYDAFGLFAGECREPEYMEELKLKTAALQLDQSVLFLGRRNDIPDLLKAINVLMIPSSFEGFPLAGLEAAAAGVPVAACDVAGAEEFVSVSGGGKSFRENDAEDAIGAVEYIMMNRSTLAENGKQFALNCSYEAYAARLRDVFASE